MSETTRILTETGYLSLRASVAFFLAFVFNPGILNWIGGNSPLKGGVMAQDIHKAGILFSGGPAPSANAVISSVSLSLLDSGIPVIGFIRGYEFIQKFKRNSPELVKDLHYREIGPEISQVRNQTGVVLKTSRANPGKNIKAMDDLNDQDKNASLRAIIDAMHYLDVSVLVSIGGDDTLKTANYLWLMGFPVIHIPKTIDNDYYGIPWTFGYWTAVDYAQKIMLNLRADAQSTDSFFIVELMGRKAGWITYAAGIASEAILMVSAEDIRTPVLDIDELAEKIVDLIVLRQKRNRPYGVIALSEGIVDRLPEGMKPTVYDRHGNLIYGEARISAIVTDRCREVYQARTGKEVKIVPKQVGYETRAGTPMAFDVVLGSMLGYGAARFCLEGTYGVMVSVTDDFNLKSVPFSELIDPRTLFTRLRDVPRGSDLFNLKEKLSYARIFDQGDNV